MPSVTKSDGSVVKWTGQGMCYCTECQELFNSEAAFDAHLVRQIVDKDGRRIANYSVAQHDTSKLVKNKKGAYVTGLMPEGIYKPS